MTYLTMQTRIAGETMRADLSAEIKDAILSAITFYENERLWFLEHEETTTLVVNQPNYAVPTDFLELDTLDITITSWRYPLTPQTWGWYRDTQTLATVYTQRPTDFAYYQDQFWLYPTPNEALTLTCAHLKRLDTLSADGDTNGWMTHGEILIRNHAKLDLFSGVIRAPGGEQDVIAAKEWRDAALSNLRSKSTGRIATGHVRASHF